MSVFDLKQVGNNTLGAKILLKPHRDANRK